MPAVLKMFFGFTLFACKRIFSTSLEIEISYCFRHFIKHLKKQTHYILPQMIKTLLQKIYHKVMIVERQDISYE